jgi:uracil phosphoribosyltransferase
MGNSFDTLDRQDAGNFSENSAASNSLNNFVDKPLSATAEVISDEIKERILNEGATVEIMQSGVHQIKLSPELIEAFNQLRFGYPNSSYEQQTKGREFRHNANLIIEQIAKETMADLNPAEVVVLMPWRAGLAFGDAYRKLGVTRFFHVSASRNHSTLKTEVDYQQGNIYPADTVIIADPMLATGNTAFDSIDRILEQGVSPENIIINAVVAAPVGVRKVKINPQSKVVVGMLDHKLDHRGYIVPGLGDFGDKYFHEFSQYELHNLAKNLNLSEETTKKLFLRFGISQY